MTQDMMQSRFDLEKQMNAIIDTIALWNFEGRT
jgi:hypothetical protein